jgi:hypothetical protein
MQQWWLCLFHKKINYFFMTTLTNFLIKIKQLLKKVFYQINLSRQLILLFYQIINSSAQFIFSCYHLLKAPAQMIWNFHQMICRVQQGMEEPRNCVEQFIRRIEYFIVCMKRFSSCWKSLSIDLEHKSIDLKHSSFAWNSLSSLYMFHSTDMRDIKSANYIININ